MKRIGLIFEFKFNPEVLIKNRTILVDSSVYTPVEEIVKNINKDDTYYIESFNEYSEEFFLTNCIDKAKLKTDMSLQELFELNSEDSSNNVTSLTLPVKINDVTHIITIVTKLDINHLEGLYEDDEISSDFVFNERGIGVRLLKVELIRKVNIIK